MKRINLYAIVWLISLLLTGISLNAETINVSTAGSLESLLGDKKHVVENLTLTGSLNGSDIRCIRQMGKLTALNMKDAYIVEGGAPYYGTFYTYGNAIGEQMFYGLSKLASIVIPSSVTSIGNSAFADCIYNHRTTKTNQKYPSVNL
ncbi:leucine-rich repeat domain-containing protein [Jilunia laotingensis]|nr:leucine-rich repeat domain-containing protein [Jilunia laotingensis]